MVSTTINLDNELAMQFESLCKEVGTSVNSAIIAFIRNSVRLKSIKPDEEEKKDKARKDLWETFLIMRKQAAEVPEMTIEEINAEIAACRAERR